MTNKEYQAALRKLAKAIEKEFLAAVYNKTGKLSVAEIIAAIESGNAGAVADLISLVPADLTQILRTNASRLCASQVLQKPCC